MNDKQKDKKSYFVLILLCFVIQFVVAFFLTDMPVQGNKLMQKLFGGFVAVIFMLIVALIPAIIAARFTSKWPIVFFVLAGVVFILQVTLS